MRHKYKKLMMESAFDGLRPSEDGVKMASMAHDRCTDAVNSLRYLASAFSTVGNATVSEDLFEIAHKVEESSKKAYDAFSACLTQRCNDSQRHSGQLLLAALAGAGSEAKVFNNQMNEEDL